MRASDLYEFSPNTFQGSITKDLLASKIWLCDELKKLDRTDFDTVYILGSWFGIMAYTLHRCGIEADKIINVDINSQWLKFSQALLKHLGNVEPMKKDVNDLDYRQLGPQGLVINTSSNEIPNQGWLDHIPQGTVVAIEGRNDVDSADSLKDFDQEFTLGKTLYLGKRNLKDPEVKYTRFLKIGVK